MKDPVGSFQGWTLAEALEVCVDPDLLSGLADARAAWVAAGSPTRFVRLHHRSPHDGTGVGRRLYHEKRNADLEVVRALRRLLHDGRLVAWGRRESPMADPRPIPPGAWSALRIVDSVRSVAKENTKAETEIFDIRVYPVVEAPDAVVLLADRTFVEACRTCVWEDPQVAVARKRASAANGRPASFGYVWPPYRAVWPAQYGTSLKQDSPVGIFQEKTHTTELSRVADELLGSRFARLIGYLARGELVAEGLPRSGGRPASLPRSLWQRRHTYVDLENGDLIELSPHARDQKTALSRPIFTGLTLKEPTASHPSVADHASEAQPARNIGKAISRVLTDEEMRTECCAWLVGEMRRSPNARPKSKDEWWKEAQERWRGRLSRRAFDGCWSEAVRQSEARAWSAAGAPRKSRRQQSSR